MATSGSVNSSYARDSYFRVTWERTSYSIPNNTSTIKWTLYLVSGNYWYLNAVKINSVVINGVTVKGSETYSYKYQETYTLASGTQTISHNNDGTKSFTISISGWFYDEGNVSGSKSFTLDSIPRYANVTQSLSSKTETTATMKWTADATVDYIWYSTNNGSSWTGINVADGTSGTYTIEGLTANTTYQVKTRVRRKDSQLTKDSSALAVTTYAYPYASGMPNFTIGDRLTLTIYNPLGRSVTVNILGADDSQISNDTTTGTSISGYNGVTVVNRLYASIPNAQSGTYKVKVTYGEIITTKTGGTYTVNPSDCSPVIESVAYQDTNSAAVGITGNNQDIVRNQSVVRYTASGLAGQKSASVSSCKVEVNGNSYNLTLSGSSATGGNAVIDSGTDVTAVFTVTDSRGLTASKSITVKMLDWSVPSAIITMQRQDNYYSETDITVDADYPYINGGNRITITYKAKQAGTSTFTVSGTLQDNVQSTFVADNNFDWDVVVTLVDSFGGTTTYNLHLSRGMPIIYFDRLRSSVGINCFPKEDKSLEVNGVNVLKSVMTRSLSANVTDLVVSTYTVIPLDLSISAGDKLTATDDGGIRIGANVSKVLVSARASIQGSSTTGRRHLRIMKNSYTNNTLAWSQDDFAASVTEDIVITPTLASVQEGDVIYLWYYVPNTADTLGGNAYGARTSMTVETVE